MRSDRCQSRINFDKQAIAPKTERKKAYPNRIGIAPITNRRKTPGLE
ncbi:MAG: hypothetical protein KME38_02545 [Spirirestis rafaelensis WJT71-NPBG6]|nr:hypothetical protein [Spirirestis rafaelensis WJT71-NPBG6]